MRALETKRRECKTGHICVELINKAIGAVVPGCLEYSGVCFGPQLVVAEAGKQTQNNATRHGFKRWKNKDAGRAPRYRLVIVGLFRGRQQIRT